jgi:hypothetical protein
MTKGFLDPLYGETALPDYAWQAAKAPEVQRLREVRMCNINSLSLMGAAAVHRFEHSIGTTFLAQTNAAAGRSNFHQDDERLLTLAALLHDVGSAGFGHSVEYMIHGGGFRHDDLLALSSIAPSGEGYEYKIADLEPVFFGLPRMLTHLLSRSDLESVAKLIGGGGRLGPLISGSIDLDNIDNVYRMAYHMGIWRNTSVPIDLARALYVDSDGLRIDESAVELVDDWRMVRGELYRWLLLDEDEFAAKAMLERALRSANESSERSFRWRDVDYSLMLKLQEVNAVSASLAERVMGGDLYGCLGIFETVGGSIPSLNWGQRDSLETELQGRLRRPDLKKLAKLGVAIHFIQDVNKTDREVSIKTSGGKLVRYGSRIDRTLVGVFATNKNFVADGRELERIRASGAGEAVGKELGALLGRPLREIRNRSVGSNQKLDYFA